MKKLKKIISVILVSAALVCTAGCGIGGGSLNAKYYKLNDSDFFQKYYEDPEKYEYLVEGFGVSQGQIRSFVRNYDFWFGSKVGIEISNRNDFDITVIGLTLENNGTDYVYVNLKPRAAVTVPANAKETSRVWFDILDDGSELDNEQVLEILKNKNPKLVYVDASTGITDVKDASPDQLFYQKIK